MFIVYISHSKKLDRFYIGYTEDFEKRLDFHLDISKEEKIILGPFTEYEFIKEKQKRRIYLEFEK